MCVFFLNKINILIDCCLLYFYLEIFSKTKKIIISTFVVLAKCVTKCLMVCRVQIWESYFWFPVKEYCHAKCMFTIIVTSHCVVWCSFLYQSTWLSSLSIVIEQDGRGRVISFSIWGVHFVINTLPKYAYTGCHC